MQCKAGRGAPRVWDVQSQQGGGRARADGLHRCGQVKSVGRVSRECGRVEAVPADGCFVPHAESLFRSLTLKRNDVKYSTVYRTGFTFFPTVVGLEPY